MAWISVDQKLIGGKLRGLYKAIGCSQNEAIGILVSLWLWGIDNAETDGLMVSANREDIKNALLSGLSREINGSFVVDCLIDTGWIDDIGGQLYLHNWGKWRSYYNRYVKDKKGNCERQARYKARQREKTDENVKDNITANVTVTGSVGKEENIPEENVKARKPKKTVIPRENKYPPEFEEFWKIYPRKVDKGQALKMYKARINEGYSQEQLKQAAEMYRKQCDVDKVDQKFIKHAKTFLGSSGSFTEYIPEKQETQSSSQAVLQTSGIRSL